MRVLLTGAHGMVGRNLLEHPESRKYEILAPTKTELDLRDFNAVVNFLSQNSPDIIIHAAGRVGGIYANIQNQLAFFVENLDMGRNIVLAAYRTGISKLVNIGSSCIYPRNAQSPLKEEMILKGELEPTNEGYALAKIATIKLCEYISCQSGFYYKTLIPCNIYGRYDKFDPASSHMLPAAIHKVHTAKIEGSDYVEIWGTGKARREYLYAEELADCIWKAVEEFDSLPMLMNVGVGYDFTIAEYYQIVAKVIGYEGRFIFDESKPEGMKQKLVSIERLERWGWKAKKSLQEGIAKTYQFYLERVIK